MLFFVGTGEVRRVIAQKSTGRRRPEPRAPIGTTACTHGGKSGKPNPSERSPESTIDWSVRLVTHPRVEAGPLSRCQLSLELKARRVGGEADQAKTLVGNSPSAEAYVAASFFTPYRMRLQLPPLHPPAPVGTRRDE